MSITKRDFIKNNTATAVATVAGMTLPASVTTAEESADNGILRIRQPDDFVEQVPVDKTKFFELYEMVANWKLENQSHLP